MTLFTPGNTREIAEIAVGVSAADETLDIVGGGTRAGLGRPATATHRLATGGLAGIVLHEPAGLVMGAAAGTPLALVEAELAKAGQMLPFEPMDHRHLFGSGGEPSIGAVFAANISGPRRIAAGAARDHLIGVTLVNGRGQVVRNGGRVMKNVTGLDLVKLSAGAMGTLGVITEVIFKVLPRPQSSVTLVLAVDNAVQAVSTMTRAMGSTADVSGAAFLPQTGVLLRLEGFAPSVNERFERLRRLLGGGEKIEVDAALWRDIGNVAPLADLAGEIWRLSVAPSRAAEVISAVRALVSGLLLDWSGGLIWLAAPEDGGLDTELHRLAGAARGHATLVRASANRRASIPVYQPLAEPLMRLTRGIKASFDPAGIFNPGRMYREL